MIVDSKGIMRRKENKGVVLKGIPTTYTVLSNTIIKYHFDPLHVLQDHGGEW